MFDGKFRAPVDRAVVPIGNALRRTKLTPDHLTVVGLLVGVGAAVAIGAGELRLGSIVHLDIRLQLLVFQIIALHIFHAYLRDTEHQGRIDLRFPPYGCHGSRNRGADQLADT